LERRWKNKQEADGTYYHSSLIVELRMIRWRVEVLYYEIQEKGGKSMKKSFFLLMVLSMFLLLGTTSCTRSHFGVPDRAWGYPSEFDEMEATIARAEKSPGAQYCPEKIARAKELGKQGVEIWWGCDQVTAWRLFAEARQLAKEAEECQPSAKPRVEEKVIILASEPKVEEKVKVLASEPKEKVIILAFEDVHFDFDKSTLTNEAQVILKRNIQILKDNPKVKVRIAGYTSASGTEEYNQRLSERRARAVEDYLIKEGVITPDKLSMIGYGKTRPAEYEAAPKDLYSTAAKANMRVLFEIIVK
jgi:outer membrane protein OmpA-like peptidoglycan-associated protein